MNNYEELKNKILGVKRPKWRPFNVKLTETCYFKIRELVGAGHSSSVTEFIRDAIWEKIEKMELKQKQNLPEKKK